MQRLHIWVALKSLQLASWLASPEGFDDPTEVAGIRLRNKVGIAAGFDKDGNSDRWLSTTWIRFY